MKITILTYGSRGDVQPFLALALGLQKAGHTVTLAAPQRFEDLVGQFGVRFAALAGDPDVISRSMNDAGGNVFRTVKGVRDYVFSIALEVVKDARKAVEGADLIVHSFLFTTGAHSLACEMGIPDVSVQAFPIFAPTRAFPNIAMTDTQIGWVNFFSHWFATQIFWHGGNAGYYQLRRGSPAGFPDKIFWPFSPSKDRETTPLIFAYSPVVVPRPADWSASHIHIAGYFFLDHPDYQPPAELRDFLEAGDAPVCVTFGSMVNREAERVSKAILQGLASNGTRAVFLTGWGGWKPENPPASTFFIDSVPHDWLFPRCSVVVHHGGAGTTAAGLRAGVPSVVVPHAADQPYWGRRVAAIGAGAQPIAVKRLTAENFSIALAQARSSSMRNNTAGIGRLIQAEDGVKAAVDLIEKQAAGFKADRSGAG